MIVLIPAIIAIVAYYTKSFWGDEILSIQFASQPVEKLFSALAADYHPPLYFLLLKGWFTLFGDGEFGLRLFQGLMGSLLLLFSLKLFRKIFPDRSFHPFWFLFVTASELWLFGPMVRYYVFAASLVVLSTVVFFRWFEKSDNRNSIFLLFTYIGILYTDYPSSIVIVFHLLYAGWKKRESVKKLLLIDFFAGVIFLPWAVVTFSQIQSLLQAHRMADFNASPIAIALKVGYSLYAFVAGEMIYPFELIGIVGMIAVGAIILIALKRKILLSSQFSRYAVSFVFIGVVFTSVITTFISTHTSFIYTPARTFFVLPFVFVIFGLLFDNLKTKSLKILLITTMIVLNGYGIMNWTLNRHFLMPVYATPWKVIMHDIENRSGWILADESLCYEYYQNHLDGSFPQLKKFSTTSEIEQAVKNESPSNIFLLQMGRESTESEIPEEIVQYFREKFTTAGVSKYLIIDESYRIIKAKLLKRDSYDAKVTLYHFLPQ